MDASASDYGIVVVGVSAGGLQALRTLVSGLPEDFGIPVVVVQHRSKDSELLCDLLQDCTGLTVSEATDKEPIRGGQVCIAPPDYHLLVEPGFVSLSTDEPVRFSRPSIDVTFESAADAYGARTVGVVMTGANSDGSRGLRRITDVGGHPVVQDPATAEVRVMPAAALRAVPEAEVVPLDRMAAYLVELQRQRPALPRKRYG